MAASVTVVTGESRPRGAAAALQRAFSTGWHDPSMHGALADALNMAGGWGVEHAALSVVGRDGELATVGDGTRQFPWASVTKLAVAYAVLRAVERGSVSLDEWRRRNPLQKMFETISQVLDQQS